MACAGQRHGARIQQLAGAVVGQRVHRHRRAREHARIVIGHRRRLIAQRHRRRRRGVAGQIVGHVLHRRRLAGEDRLSGTGNINLDLDGWVVNLGYRF